MQDHITIAVAPYSGTLSNEYSASLSILPSVQKNFSIYRSSAGSGKTYTLAKEYLLLALRSHADYFKHILAVTFTNKSTQEMKDRILYFLDGFIHNRNDTQALAAELKATLKQDDNTFLERVNEVRSQILHKYDSFAISTIDAFFQKVIRSFTREAGIGGDYRLEVEHDAVLEEVIDNLMEELGTNHILTDWVVEFARVNLENERNWDVRNNLIAFAQEIFKEEFRTIENEFYKNIEKPDYFKTLLHNLKQSRKQYIISIRPVCQLLYNTVRQHGLNVEDFKGKSTGIFNLINKLNKIKNISDEEVKDLNKDLSKWTDPAEWPHPKSSSRAQVFSLASTTLVPLLQDIISIHQQHYKESLSADLVLSNFYAFGLTADIARKLIEYKKENNTLLLTDAPAFLNGIIQDSDTPFIYEKVGSFYRNYLIDEFQDTSNMQWKNFLPLLTNSLDQGYKNLVVGDVKQAIYRWRGGDLKLLQQTVEEQIGSHRTSFSELDKNFRSAPALVEFNNAIFKSTSAWVAHETGIPLAAEVYKDAAQQPAKKGKGLVHVDFFKKEKSSDDDGEDEKETSWKQQALTKIPFYLEQLQDRGVALRDIAFLVRSNLEGQEIAAYLLQYKNTQQTEDKPYRYDVISNESLLIEGATTVKLLVSALQYLFNTENGIARAQLSYEFARLHEPDRELFDVFTVSNQTIFENNLPPAFSQEKSTLRKLPLFELTESLIRIFDLGNKRGELIYLQTFQDLVLDFYTREKNDLGAFLEWWEINKTKKSIQVSGEINAAQIITIHKSKGLQFPYVILPFCSWKLNHDGGKSPTLWVKSDESIFAAAGYVPVKYNAALANTYFASFYEDERARCYLDNLNILYVALTRAEKGMIIMAPYPVASKKNAVAHNVAGLLYHSFETNETLQSHFNAGALFFRSGEWPDMQAPKKELIGALSLHEYVVSPWREKLVIRQSGKTFFHDSISEVRHKINYGIHMHAILSRIHYIEDIPDALDKLVFEGLIAPSEKETVHEQLRQLLQHPLIASWFTRNWDVRTEVPILLPGGAENRIDRLLLNTANQTKQAVIIDFKTGKKTKQDRQQVADYIGLLHHMNFVQVEGYLLYLQDTEIVPVHAADKTPAPKSKNENQLGLF